jgi:hypothetical protein
MNGDPLTMAQASLRGTDSNSLLRLYDQVRAHLARSQSQQERGRAEKAMQRLADELRKRNVRL